MSGNIEDFLRKAAQQRKQRRQQTAPAPPPQNEPVEIVEPEVVHEPLVPERPFHSSADSQVSQHLSNAGFQERASHLGEEVGLSDDRLEERLHETFDHRLGQLSGESLSDDAYEQIKEQSEMAMALARMLRSPKGLRNAIVLSEVLKRPEHRW